MRMENCLPNFSYSDEILKKGQKFFFLIYESLTYTGTWNHLGHTRNETGDQVTNATNQGEKKEDQEEITVDICGISAWRCLYEPWHCG